LKILENWLGIEKAGTIASISKNTIYYHSRQGNIRTMKDPSDSRKILYNKADIIKLYELKNKEETPERKEVKNKNSMMVNDQHCKDCPWKEGPVCPFVRCVRHNGWSAEVKDIANIR